MKRFLIAAFVLILAFGSIVSAQSPLDGFNVNFNGGVSAIAIQPNDGKIIVGGGFTQVNGVARNKLARLNVDRTLDTTFNPNANGNVNAIVVQPDGKILVGGNFTQIAGQTKWALARLNSSGSLDATFGNENVTGYVLSIALDLNGHVIIGGFFDYVDTENRNHVARFDKDTGELDLSFNPNVTDTLGGWSAAKVTSIVVQFDGQIVIGGKFDSVGGLPRKGLARLNPNTGVADFFNPYPDFASEVTCLARQINGNILVGGILLDGRVFKKVARISYITGNEDPTFSATFSGDTENPGGVYSIASDSTNKVLVGGFFFTVNGQSRNTLARLNTDGSLDTGFYASNPNGIIGSFAVQPSGKILIGGGFSIIGGVLRNRFAGLEVNGELDKTLDLGALNGAVQIIVPQPDGKIIIAGLFTSVLGISRNKIARLNVDGSLDTAFNPNPSGGGGRVFAIALDSTGRIYAGGDFTNIGGENRDYLARLDPITGAADSYIPFISDFVLAIHVDSFDTPYIGGGFTSVGGAGYLHIAKLDPNTGAPDLFFHPNPNGDVNVITQDSSGRVIFGGNFTELNPEGTPETHNHIARVYANGDIDGTFNTDVNATVRVMKLQPQPDEKILIAGDFTQVNGVNRNYIARLNSDGSLDTAFSPNPNDRVTSITVQSNGKILITGYFSAVNMLSRNRVARLNEITGLPEFLGGTVNQYDPNVNGDVLASAILPDGKVLIGGDFSTVGGISRSNFARLSNDTYAFSELTISRTSISWQIDGSTQQLNRVRFELSTDGGATYTFLGNGTPGFGSFKDSGNLSPTALNYTLSGLNLPTGQNILIRAAGSADGSASAVEKLQSAFLLAPSAANVSISGRVLTSDGRGLANAVVSLTDSSGNPRTTRTGSFGFYRFDGIEAGQTVLIVVISKRFQFVPRVLTLNENLSDVDFTANDSGNSFK